MNRAKAVLRVFQSSLAPRLLVPILTLAGLVSMLGCNGGRSTQTVSDFTLPQVRGGSFHLRGENARAVLLAFLQTVPDTADTASRQQVGFLLSMQHQYGANGLRVVIIDSSQLVSGESPHKDDLINASYDWHLDIPLLEDDDNLVARNSGVTQVPTMVLLASDGSTAQRWNEPTRPSVLAQEIEKLCGSSATRN